MTRLEIATQILVAHISKMNASPISNENIGQALNVADGLIYQDKERTDAASAELRKAREAAFAQFGDQEKSAADLVAELAYGPKPSPVKGGFTPYRKKPNFFERFFSGGGPEK